MTLLVNLIGASGSGKTTIAKELDKIGYNIIQSYTTRPPRKDGEWGHTFIGEYTKLYDGMLINSIITNKALRPLIRSKIILFDDMIAYFNSYNSGHHYFATDEQVIRNKTNIYIVDPNGAEQVKQFYKDTDIKVINIFLQVDEEKRKERLIKRYMQHLGISNINTCLTYRKALKKANERLKHDINIFEIVKTDYVIDNNSEIEKTIKNLEKILK